MDPFHKHILRTTTYNIEMTLLLPSYATVKLQERMHICVQKVFNSVQAVSCHIYTYFY